MALSFSYASYSYDDIPGDREWWSANETANALFASCDSGTLQTFLA